MDTKAQYAELKQKLADLRTEMQTVAKKYFQDNAKGLFATHSILERFAWTQYTPYFNDGDPCEFSAHVDYPEVNDDEEFFYYSDSKKKPTDPFTVAGLAVVEFLKAFSGDDLEEMFGDHCKVTVTREGVEVEEYDHD